MRIVHLKNSQCKVKAIFLNFLFLVNAIMRYFAYFGAVKDLRIKNGKTSNSTSES